MNQGNRRRYASGSSSLRLPLVCSSPVGTLEFAWVSGGYAARGRVGELGGATFILRSADGTENAGVTSVQDDMVVGIGAATALTQGSRTGDHGCGSASALPLLSVPTLSIGVTLKLCSRDSSFGLVSRELSV